MKIIETIADQSNLDTIRAIGEQHDIFDMQVGNADERGFVSVRMMVPDDRLQAMLDALQNLLGRQAHARILVIPVEAVISADTAGETERAATPSPREVMYHDVQQSTRMDSNYYLLVALSTLVAAIGLLENNATVVIGAMLIAPLLGPNLAFGLGTALGDLPLIRRSFVAGLSGILLALLIGFVIGAGWQSPAIGSEILSRTRPGLDTIALALASGAAAALSLTSGLSSVLVGVMVAVALLPPTAAIGLLLGRGLYDAALGAALLLAINIVSVNLACKLVFLLKGIRPRTWWEKEKARAAMRRYLTIWVLTLGVLAVLITRLPGG